MTFLEDFSAAKMSIDYYCDDCYSIPQLGKNCGMEGGVGEWGVGIMRSWHSLELNKNKIHLLLLDSLWHEIVSKALFRVEKDSCCTLSTVQHH